MNERTPLQDHRQQPGDREAIVGEFMRFTRQEHEAGMTQGWHFESGWHTRASGLQWAWFSRGGNDEATIAP